MSEMWYVSAASWQTRFHSSAPASMLQGVLSDAPAPRPRRLDFFLVSSLAGAGVKCGTSRQHRKWLTAAERLGTSTPCKDIDPRLQFSPSAAHTWRTEERCVQNAVKYLEETVEHSSGWASEDFRYDQPLFKKKSCYKSNCILKTNLNYLINQTHHYMPQALLVLWLADGRDYMAQISQVDASLV